MAYATFDGYVIPKVYDAKIERITIGETARTASGKLRQDIVAIKRRWTLYCRPVPKEKIMPLLNHLESTLYSEGAFWLYGMDVPVVAKINPDEIEEQIVGIPDEDGTWRKDGRIFTFVVEEV